MLVTRESGVSGTAIVSTIALDHVLITLVHGLAATALGFLLPLPETLERYRLLALGTLIALGVAMALVLRVPHRAEVEQRRAGTVRRHVREFAATMKHVMTGRRLAISLPLLALYWCLGLTAIHCAAHALDVPISIGVSTAAFLAVSAGGMVQSTPGNIGVTQMAYAGTAHLLGVPVDQAVGVALLYQAVQTVPVLLVAIPVLGASLRSYGGDALTEPAELRASRATAGVQLQPRQSGAAPRPPRRSPPS